jgi:hypothetical protein
MHTLPMWWSKRVMLLYLFLIFLPLLSLAQTNFGQIDAILVVPPARYSVSVSKEGFGTLAPMSCRSLYFGK